MTKAVLLLTRPEPSAKAFAARLSDSALAQVKVMTSPVLAIVSLSADVSVTDATTVIFTSANGVDNAPSGAGRRAVCVGERTTARAQQRGWNAELLGLDADDLVKNVIARGIPGPFLHLTGRHQRGEIAARLCETGIEAHALPIYDQKAMALTDEAKAALKGDCPVILPVFSPRSALQLVPWLTNARTVHAVAISDATAAPLAKIPLKNITIAPLPTGAAMQDCLEKIMLRYSLA